MPDSTGSTIEHRRKVAGLISVVITHLLYRSLDHDSSKSEYPEKEILDNNIERMKRVEYGTDEYYDLFSQPDMQLLREHHNRLNRHHPEHYTNGINDMNLIDLIEMLCDWITKNKDEDVYKNIELTCKYLRVDKQLENILFNTWKEYLSH